MRSRDALLALTLVAFSAIADAGIDTSAPTRAVISDASALHTIWPQRVSGQRLLLSAGCQDLPPAWPLYGDVLLVEEQIRRHGGRRDQAREGDRSEECAAQMHSRRAGAKEFRDSGLRFLMDLELNIDT